MRSVKNLSGHKNKRNYGDMMEWIKIWFSFSVVGAMIGGGFSYIFTYGNLLYFVTKKIRDLGIWIDGLIGRKFGFSSFFYEWLPRPLTCSVCASGWVGLLLSFGFGVERWVCLLSCFGAMGLSRYMYDANE